MATKKISQLPAATQGNSTDLLEKSDQGGAPSQKITLAQVLTFIQNNATAFAKDVIFALSVSSGNGLAVMNADGSGVFANGLILLNPDGSASFSNGFITLVADGSASFSNTAVVIDPNGSIFIPNIGLSHNGSATFANAKFTINIDGSFIAQPGGVLASSLILAADGSFAIMNAKFIFNADGTINFNGGALTIGALGQLVGISDIEITDTTKGYILKSPNGTRYRIKVDNAGNLGTVLVP